MNRDGIYNALLTQLTGAGTAFLTYSRHWRPVWDDAGGDLLPLPALFMQDRLEKNVWNNRGIGDVVTLIVQLEVYAKLPRDETPSGPDKTAQGSSVIAPLVDAIVAALAPGVGDEMQTLGGLCYDCRVDDTTIKMLGDEDPDGRCSFGLQVHIVVAT